MAGNEYDATLPAAAAHGELSQIDVLSFLVGLPARKGRTL